MLARQKILTLLSFLVIWPVLASQSLAIQKHALLIGINDYQNIPSLNKAVGDAKAMSETMERLGFKVTLVLNPTRRKLNQAITKFRSAIQPGDTALVHYSGHGIEISGRNFLLPADIPKPNSGEQDLIESEGLSLNKMIDRISSSGAAVRIFVIDACRDNPFAKEGTRSLGGTRGLAEVKTTAGTFIFYSAGFGQTALDSLGPDDKATTSVYTRTLIETIQKPFPHIGSVARKVRQKVEILANSIGHTQFPAYYDELSGDYCIGCGTASAQVAGNSNNPNAGHGAGNAANSNLSPGSSAAQPARQPASKQYPDLIIVRADLQATGQCKSGRPVMNSTIVVRNIGNASAGNEAEPVMVNIQNTRDAIRGWGNGSKLGVIPPGAEKTAHFPLFFPKQTPDVVNGLHEFKITIDPKNKIRETNSQNNVSYKEISFSCPQPKQPQEEYQTSDNDNRYQPVPIAPQTIAPARNLPRGGPKSFWDHSGSLMFLKADGNKRAFFYKNPRRILKAAGIRDGSLLFHGKIAGGNYLGKMRKFSRRCGTIEFPVRGIVNNNNGNIRVIFRSNVPTRNIRTCQTTGSKRKTLVFKFLYTAKDAKIKQLNPNIRPPRPLLNRSNFRTNRNNRTRLNNRRPINRPVRNRQPRY